ncbi:hypothetical protein [Streptomyces sp. NPDC058476]|uniref:hypothetical protein n=1 Tax=unclassified Streptomyces TaxID=2593676 RepID=UPI00365089AF
MATAARASRTRKITTWTACGAGAVVLALTGYALLSGGGDGDEAAKDKGGASASATPGPTKPAPTYTAPDDWTEPQRWASLPRGEKTDGQGNDIGFPHTQEGAVAMLAAASSTDVNRERSTVEEQLGHYRSYMAAADLSPANEEKVKAQAEQTDGKVRSDLGLAAGSALPAGAYVRNHVVGFKIIQASPDEVSVYLLARATLKAGETKKERDSYSRTLVAAEWEAGDWKLSSAATVRAAQQTGSSTKPPMVSPGDAAFNQAGWVAIREAS